ncbi:type III polyketide synthase [Glycomyces terrestris]|uniref:Type III polyketide synthase n=1 Tax=Glycomyces terrestris TaxID=2493553 RepID=A0A426UWB6_9ACTN|nr:3-oxoacyl-[acyl-carrier-protein] synthase III C-terminal domain-containing protein [Glycomyces terrestris]RRR98508.1 type III polyketide synthase [Glycomyces terrestris]
MSAGIAGIGTALPPQYEQDWLWEHVFRSHFGGSRIAGRMFDTAGVARRHSSTPPHELADAAAWSTAERMRRYAERAPALGLRAVRRALAAAGTEADEIGLIAVATCTGYGTPGTDIDLAEALPLRPDARRLLVGHMGCHAAIPALGAVADYVAAHDRPAVLLCVELTSLHVQPATRDTDQAVVHALFSDAAAAAVLRPGAPAPLRVVDVAARTDTARRGHMTWRVTDLGFRMGLSPEVPEALSEHVGPLVKDLLARHGLDRSEVAGWAVHPGGPRVLDAVAAGLDLAPTALDPSRRVLAEHGNCSSATVLLVLDEILRAGPPDGPVVMLAFGPGLTLYASLLAPA